jgi:hypothetical protein
MYLVRFFNGNRTLLEKSFNTFQEAEDFAELEPQEFSGEYHIIDTEKDEIIADGAVESNDDIVEGTMNMMFPDEGSMEGFEADTFFESD